MATVHMHHSTVIPPGSGLLLFTFMIVTASQLQPERPLLMLLVAVNTGICESCLFDIGLQQICWMCLLGSMQAHLLLCIAHH